MYPVSLLCLMMAKSLSFILVSSSLGNQGLLMVDRYYQSWSSSRLCAISFVFANHFIALLTIQHPTCLSILQSWILTSTTRIRCCTLYNMTKLNESTRYELCRHCFKRDNGFGTILKQPTLANALKWGLNPSNVE